MNSLHERAALEFVGQLGLPETGTDLELERITEVKFDPNKNQALVVGSGIVAFAKGISAEFRQDIVNSALLAQLAANKQVSDPTNVEQWYKVYLDVLTKIGWTIRDRQFVERQHLGPEIEVQDAIMAEVTDLLGSIPRQFHSSKRRSNRSRPPKKTTPS